MTTYSVELSLRGNQTNLYMLVDSLGLYVNNTSFDTSKKENHMESLVLMNLVCFHFGPLGVGVCMESQDEGSKLETL